MQAERSDSTEVVQPKQNAFDVSGVCLFSACAAAYPARQTLPGYGSPVLHPATERDRRS